MTWAILKLSYNLIGDSTTTGGICGSAFFIDEKTALTANHILSTSNYKPNENYRKCQYWLISREGRIINLKKEYLVDLPQIDTTVIKFQEKQIVRKPFELSDKPPIKGEEVLTQGFVGEDMPKIDARWAKDCLLIESVNLRRAIADRHGFVKSNKILDVNANDIKLNDIKGVELSFPGIIGMSGGPLIRKSTGEVIGLLSIGLPPDVQQKKSLFAISVEEINRALKELK